MSIFAVGGNLGFAIGPIITSIALSIWGIKGSIVLIIPATIMSFVMFYFNQKLTDISVVKKSNHGSSENKEVEKMIGYLSQKLSV